MKMKRNLWLFILVISTMVSSVSAQSFKQRFKKILGKDKSELALNATSLPKPYININNNIVLSDTIDFNVIEDNIVFINALSYTIKQGEKGKRNIETLNILDKKFQAKIQSEVALEDEKTSVYVCQINFLMNGSKLTVYVDSINVIAPGLFGEIKSTPFENLNMQKDKSIQQMQEFTTIYQLFINGLKKYITQTKPQSVTHWKEIKEGKAVQGMNETECLLSVGTPKFIRENGTKTRWMIEDNVAIIFEKGKVVDIIR